MRYVVFGAGAVGGLVGARLHGAGHDVVLVARGPHLDALRAGGLRLLMPDGSETYHVPAFGHIADVGLREDDVVLLCVKSQHTAAALDDIEAASESRVAVVCAQNGVANEPKALRRFADVYAMCVILPAEHLNPGEVVQHSAPLPGILDVGRYPSGEDDRVARWSADLSSAGFRSEVDKSVMRRKYRKLIMNLGNALDAVCGLSAWDSDLATRARAEGEAVLAAAGIDVQSEAEERDRRHGMTLRPVEGRPRVGSSSLQSLVRGARSIEADWLNGEIVMLGRAHGVATPVNELLRRTANRFARKGLQPGQVTPEELTAELEGGRR